MRFVLKRLFVWLWRVLKILFLVLAVLFASLFFREQKLPGFIVEMISSKCSTSEFLLRFDAVHFGFRHGLRFSGVRLFDLRRPDSLERPVGSARMVTADYFKRLVVVQDAEYGKLPDSYYEEDGTLPDPSRVEFDIPDVDEFTFVLENPRILGVEAEHVSASVNLKPRRIMLDDIRLVLPDRDCKVRLDGDLELDLDMQRIRVDLRGNVKHTQVRPLIEVLDVQCALPYMDAFTEVKDPIPASMRLKANLATKDLALRISMDSISGKYNSVGIDKVEGGIEFESFHEKDKVKTRTKVYIPAATDSKGRRLSGWVCVDDFSGPYRISMDARSELDFKDLVSVADFDIFGAFTGLKTETAPVLSAKGVVCTETDDFAANDLSGVLTFLHGSANGFSLNDFMSEYTLKGDILELDLRATGKTGGRVAAYAKLDFQKFEEGKGRFETRLDYKGGSLEEMADILKFDLGERNGKIDWKMETRGAIDDPDFSTLDGKGSFTVRDGHLAQMKLFAGLTALLAEKIPGVSFLVNQTQASCDYTIENGVFKSNNIFIEGGLISIKGWGRYDIANDDLDFTARVQFMKKESVVGRIIHPVTLPFTKLLLEYSVRGSIDDPDWKYIKILDRIF